MGAKAPGMDLLEVIQRNASSVRGLNLSLVGAVVSTAGVSATGVSTGFSVLFFFIVQNGALKRLFVNCGFAVLVSRFVIKIQFIASRSRKTQQQLDYYLSNKLAHIEIKVKCAGERTRTSKDCSISS